MKPSQLLFWKKFYKANTVGKDFAGREVRLNDHGVRSSPYGWDIDHILPKALKGKNSNSNLQITNIKTNAQKGCKTSFVINGQLYQVYRIKGLGKVYETNPFLTFGFMTRLVEIFSSRKERLYYLLKDIESIKSKEPN